MLAYGVTLEDVEAIVYEVTEGGVYVGSRFAASPTQWHTRNGVRCRFALIASDSHSHFARKSAGNGWRNPRRTNAVHWDTVRDIMRALFTKYPDARIVTSLADYRGLQGFEADHERTAYVNVGSMMYPTSLIECEHGDD